MHHDDQRAPKLTAAERRMVTEAQKWVARAEPTLAAAEEVLDELGHGDSASITAAAEDVVRSTDWEQPLHDIAAPGLQAVAQGLRDAVLPTIDTTAISALRDSALGTHRPEMAQMNRKLMEVIAPTIDMSAAAGSLGFSSSTLGFARPVDTSALFMTEKTKLLGTSIFGQYMPETHKITTAINKLVPTIDTTAISALRDSALGTHRPEMAQMNRKLMEVIAPTIDMSAAAGSLGFSSSTLGFARPVDTSALFMTEKTKLLGTSIFGQYMPETHKITTAINKLVPSIGLGSLGHVTRVTDAFAKALGVPGALGDISLPVLREFDRIAESVQGSIISLLGRWVRLGDLGHFLARVGYRAALSARDAALHDDREAVGQFAQVWLGVKKVTARIIDAVIGALIDPSWEQGEVELTIENLNRLRRREARREAGLIGSKAKGDLRMHSVDVGEGEFPFVVEPLWAPRPDPEMAVLEGFDPRIERVLAQLTATEREIVNEWAAGSSITWGEAAIGCGHGPEKGESVRRKLGRLGKQLTARQLAT